MLLTHMKIIIKKTCYAATTLLAVGAVALVGCSSSPADDDQLTVVTTTTVYADIVEQITGQGRDDVQIKAVIDSPAQDPHSYEATPQDRLSVQSADLVVLNGGGYDAFMEELAKETGVPVINAVEVSGLEGAEEAGADHHHDHGAEDPEHRGHSHGSFNEHIWYDPTAMGKLGDAVAQKLGDIDHEHAHSYDANAQEFSQSMDQLYHRAQDAALSGDYVATEPVAGYLLEIAGLHDLTPTAFTVAIEDGTDAAPLVYDEVRTVVEDDAALLVYNEQTSTGQSQDLRKVAEDSKVPVISMSETLPEGKDYREWMEENIARLEKIGGLKAEPGAAHHD